MHASLHLHAISPHHEPVMVQSEIYYVFDQNLYEDGENGMIESVTFVDDQARPRTFCLFRTIAGDIGYRTFGHQLPDTLRASHLFYTQKEGQLFMDALIHTYERHPAWRRV